MLARHGAAVAHCPTTNAALGSGLFPLGSHLALGVRVALGSDVGAGTGFSLFKEGLQAYFVQQLLGREGHRLSVAAPAAPGHRRRRRRARAVGRRSATSRSARSSTRSGCGPPAGSTLDVALRHADSARRRARQGLRARPAAGATSPRTWVAGERVAWASRRRAASGCQDGAAVDRADD